MQANRLHSQILSVSGIAAYLLYVFIPGSKLFKFLICHLGRRTMLQQVFQIFVNVQIMGFRHFHHGVNSRAGLGALRCITEQPIFTTHGERTDEAFCTLAEGYGIQIQPGDAVIIYPRRAGMPVQRYSYDLTGGSSAELVKNNLDLLERVKIYSKKARVSYGHLMFMDELYDVYRIRRIEELKKKTKESKDWFSELEQLDADNAKLKEEIYRLKAQIAGLTAKAEAKKTVRDNSVTLDCPEISEFYEDEVRDLIISILRSSISWYCAEDTRKYELIQRLIDSNELTGEGQEIFREFKTILFRNNNVTGSDIADLQKLGFEVTQLPDQHMRITFKGDVRYASVMPGTGSDWRGLKNAYSEMVSKISVYKGE